MCAVYHMLWIMALSAVSCKCCYYLPAKKSERSMSYIMSDGFIGNSMQIRILFSKGGKKGALFHMTNAFVDNNMQVTICKTNERSVSHNHGFVDNIYASSDFLSTAFMQVQIFFPLFFFFFKWP